MASANSTDDTGVVFWALNGYGVTVLDLMVNFVILLLGSAIMVLNALVLDTMVRLKQHPEPADVMVCSLAIADFLMGVFIVYHTSYNLINYQYYLECLIRFGFANCLMFTSIFHLVGLTLDRYIKIMSPYTYSTCCHVLSVATLSGVIWIISIVFAMLPAMGWNREPDQPDHAHLSRVKPGVDIPVCSFFGIVNSDFLRLLVVLFWFSIFVMALLYLHIFKIANKHARIIAAQECSQPAPKLKDRHFWKYTKTVVIILGIFLLCWLPSGIVIMMFVLGNLSDKTLVEQGNLLLYTSTTAYINSFVNPIIYAFKISAVKKRFRSVFCCKRGIEHSLETSMAVRTGRREIDRTTTCNVTSISVANKTELI